MIDYHQLGTPDWNDNYVHTLFVVPSKTTPDSIPKWAKYYPFSDQNGAKTLSDGAAHTTGGGGGGGGGGDKNKTPPPPPPPRALRETENSLGWQTKSIMISYEFSGVANSL